MNHHISPRQSLSFFAASLAPLIANPIDPIPTVVTGQVDFSGLDTHSAVITQQTQKAIVDYSHFNIPAGSSVQFLQPNSQASILNRITGADPSLLNGSLTANGQIYFVNPAGVTFGPNSVIRADIFMAAAGQISDTDFLNNIQNFSLSGNITNHGSIQTENGVGLFGQQVENTGELVAKKGYAIVASGDEVHVRQGGTGLTVDVTDSARSSKAGTAIRNLGTVDGEDVMFSAGDAFATAIQQSGKVTARKSAKIYSDGGRVEVSGSVTAQNDSGQGGRIEVGGTDRGASTAPSASSTTITESATLDASSDSGQGGHVVVWSDGHTDFKGQADASSNAGQGGHIEVSGKTFSYDSFVEQLRLGSGGHFLLDPTDILIDSGLASSIEGTLASGADVTLDTTSATDTDEGDITIAANIQVPTNNSGDTGTLILNATHDFIVNGDVIVQNLQEDFTPGQRVFDFTAGRDILLNGDLRHSGINGETGRGTIFLDAGRNLSVNNVSVDSNGGSIEISAENLILNGLSSGLLAGFVGENTSSVDIKATSGVTFGGGLIQTFGGTDVFIDTALLRNNTGSSAISRNDLSQSFFAVRLPNPTDNDPDDNNSGTNHIYNGIQSGSRALFNVNGLDFPTPTDGISGNRYYYDSQPTVRITAQDGSKTYGNTFNLLTGGPAVTVETSDFVQVPLGNPFLQDTTANTLDLTGVTTSSAGAVTAANVASYPITPTGATSNNGYALSYTTDGALTVNQRAITLTASQQNKQYGDVLTLDDTAFTVLDLDSDATLPNGNVIDTVSLNSVRGVDGSTTTDAATYSDEIQILGQSGSGGFLASNYDLTYVDGDLVVDQRNVTVTASPQAKSYGDVLDLSSNVSETAFTILDNGLTDNGLTDGGDAALPNGETIRTVSLQSVLPVDVAASTTESIGTYSDELRATGVTGGGGFDVNNYNLSFVDGDLVVYARPITLTPDGQAKQYGDVLPLGTTAFTVLDNGLTDGGDAALPNGEQIDTVVLVSANGSAASTDDDVATYSDNISIDSNAFDNTNGSNGFVESNYDVTFATGDLIIDQRQVELIAGRQEKFYGDALDLDDTNFTVVDQGDALDSALPNGEEVTNVTIGSTNGIATSTTAATSLYSNEINIESPVVGTAGTGDGFLESNYDITYTSGDVLVNPRPITVTPTQQEKIYGNTLTLDQTAFTVTDLDNDALLPNGESIDTVSVISRGAHDASTTSSAVTYADDLEATSVATSSAGFDLNNYTIDFSNLSDLVINRRAVTLTALQQEKDYGDVHTLDTTTFSVTDLDNDALLPNGETIDTVTLVSGGGVDSSTDADTGTYSNDLSITPTSTATSTLTGTNGFDQENYLFSYNTGDLVINQRAITLTASQQEKIYGNVLNLDDTAFTTLDKDGDSALPNGEVVTNVTIGSATGVDASTSSDVTTYTDEINIESPVVGTAGTGDGFLESNYDITYVSGDLKVNKRAIALTALPQSKTYGESVTTSITDFSVLDLDSDAALPNGESIDTVTITSSVAGDATSNVGSHASDLAPTSILTSSNGFNESNYDITRVSGTYIINQRAILLTAQDQSKIYGNTDTLEDAAFTVIDTFGGGGTNLPNGESIDAVSFAATTLPGDTTAVVNTYTDELNISGQAGSSGFLASNYDISYTAGDYSVTRRAAELVIGSDKRYAGALYQIDPTAFTTIDLDGDTILPNGESVDSLAIMSLNGVAENPGAMMGLYPGEFVADPTSALGSNGFSLSNYNLTVIPGDFEIKPFPGLAAMSQDLSQEQWILDKIGYDSIDPFANSYAISQSVGVRLLSLDSWAKLSASKKQTVLSSLDAVPLHLQTLDLAEKLIEEIK
jgi:filamentous hemagglutinin family protein